MDIARHITQLRLDGERLASVAATVRPETPVPTCPEWAVRDLVRHLGGVHRWATGYVRDARLEAEDVELEDLVGGWPDDGKLIDWFREGHAALVRSLEEAPDDLRCWTFLDAPSPRAFWARRQAHETGIHRVDAESATGTSTPFPGSFASDGIDELLFGFAGRPGRPLPLDSPATMRLEAVDASRSWRVNFMPTGFEISTDVPADAADCRVRAQASELYVLLWNRREPDGLDISGNVALLAMWRESMRVRWS